MQFLDQRLRPDQVRWLTEQYEKQLADRLAEVPQDGLRYTARITALVQAGWKASVDGWHFLHPVTRKLTSKQEAIELSLRLRPQKGLQDCAYRVSHTRNAHFQLVESAILSDLEEDCQPAGRCIHEGCESAVEPGFDWCEPCLTAGQNWW